MAMWNPWRGCHKFSEGCKFCYIHKGDRRRGAATDAIVKTDDFTAPIMKNKSGDYRMKSGQTVYLCFSTDFLIEEADEWRKECWKMIRERSDLHFVFLTKRIERFMQCIPEDWDAGYENVTVGCTVENQDRADYRLSLFSNMPIKHKNIICQPLIERIELGNYLEGIELVVVGGESDSSARPLDYEWVLRIREECIKRKVDFEFRQCGTHFIKDGKEYVLNVRQLCSQAKKAGIDVFFRKKAEKENSPIMANEDKKDFNQMIDKITVAGEENFESVYNFYSEICKEMEGSRYTTRWKMEVYPDREEIAEHIRQQEMIIGWHGGEILSVMVLAGHGSYTSLHLFAVRPQYRRKHIAGKMLSAMVDIVSGRKQKMIRLDVVQGNLPAERLYQKFGFKKTGEITEHFELNGDIVFDTYEYVITAG